MNSKTDWMSYFSKEVWKRKGKRKSTYGKVHCYRGINNGTSFKSDIKDRKFQFFGSSDERLGYEK